MLLGIVVGHDEAASCSSMDHGGGKRRDDVHYCLFLAAASGADLTSAHGSEFFRVRTPFNRRFVGTPPSNAGLHARDLWLGLSVAPTRSILCQPCQRPRPNKDQQVRVASSRALHPRIVGKFLEEWYPSASDDQALALSHSHDRTLAVSGHRYNQQQTR